MVDDLFAGQCVASTFSLAVNHCLKVNEDDLSQPLWPFRIDAQHPCSMMNIVGAGEANPSSKAL